MYQARHAPDGAVSRLSLRARFVIVACAALAVLGSGIAVAAGAGASVNPGTTVYTASEAGIQAHGNGWNFRYLQANITLPDITSNTFKAAIPGGYGGSLRLANGNQIVDLGISTTPGSGAYNAAFAVEYSDGHTYGCLNGDSPATPAGDTVTMTLYYSYAAGGLSYGVTDRTRAGHDFSGTCSDPGQFFGSAQIVAGFSVNDWTPATNVHAVSGNHRLVMFTNTVVTSRTGYRSSIGTGSGSGSGHWPVQKLAMTSDGTPTGTLLASVPYAWGSSAVSPDNVVRDGRNFSVWMPAGA